MGNIIVEIVVFGAIAVLLLLFVFPTKKNQKPFFFKKYTKGLEKEYIDIIIDDSGNPDNPYNQKLIKEINEDETLQDHLDKFRTEDERRRRRFK